MLSHLSRRETSHVTEQLRVNRLFRSEEKRDSHLTIVKSELEESLACGWSALTVAIARVREGRVSN